MPTKLESDFKKDLVDELKRLFPGVVILKNNEQHKQGVPDMLILYGPHWAILEVKRSRKAPYRPNQEYYLDTWGEHGYTATIYPENKKEILYELELALRPCR